MRTSIGPETEASAAVLPVKSVTLLLDTGQPGDHVGHPKLEHKLTEPESS